MEIKYFGNSCFRIKGKDIVLTTNPFNASLGIKIPKIETDIVLFSSSLENKKDLGVIKGALNRKEPFVINEPGEYEVGGAFILGIPFGKKTIYIITIDGIRLVFLGQIKDKLSDKELEEVDGVDILFLPVGGKPVISEKQAASIVENVQPRIVIPMSYKVTNLNIDFASVDEFLKQIGSEGLRPIDKLLISKEELPLEKEVILLDAKKN